MELLSDEDERDMVLGDLARGDLDLADPFVGDSPLSRVIRSASVHELGAQTLHLWVLDAAHPGSVQPEHSHLDRHEVARAAMVRRRRDRARYVLAHVALRVLLGRYLALAPADVVYRREPCPRCGGPNGRPALDGAPRPVHFSLSTSGDLILIGIATAPVGVDIEIPARADTVRDVGELLHEAERAELLAAPASERATVFTRLWTRKEAYLKGVGVGVGHGLATPYVGSEPRSAAPRGWSVLDVAVPHPYAAAAAMATAPAAGRR